VDLDEIFFIREIDLRHSAPDRMKVALAQINATVGDLAGNARLVAAGRAAGTCPWRYRGAGARTGPGRLSRRRPAAAAGLHAGLRPGPGRALAAELADCPGLHVVVGHPHQFGERGDVRSKSLAVQQRFNAASVLTGGCVATYCKRELPNYQVFDERRYFVSGRDAGLPPLVFEAGGVRFGVLICEDAWFDEPAQAAQGRRRAGAVRAECFALPPGQVRRARSSAWPSGRAARACRCCMPTWWAGRTRWCSTAPPLRWMPGRDRARAPAFAEDLLMLELDGQGGVRAAMAAVPHPGGPGLVGAGHRRARLRGQERLPGRHHRLVRGHRLGPGAGVAVDALGADRVRTVMMPSPYTADISWIDAREMASAWACATTKLPSRRCSTPSAPAWRQFAGLPEDTTEENLQARIRGTLLMALSNKSGAIVLTTGNKSEMATGYCTLYGDMAGGFAVIKDVAKTLVYRLADWKNQQPNRRADGSLGPVIPQRIITRPPSAELRPDQTDQDSLPPYEVLDAILARYMEEDQGIEEIVAAGFARGRRARDAPDQAQRIQAAPGAGGHPHHAPGLRARLALSHHLQVPCLNPFQSTQVNGAFHETDHRRHQAFQAGGSA
jgi:NAD+ synthase (glutamine-hydrolysing)